MFSCILSSVFSFLSLADCLAELIVENFLSFRMIDSVQRSLFREVHLISVKSDIPLAFLWQVAENYNRMFPKREEALVYDPNAPWVIDPDWANGYESEMEDEKQKLHPIKIHDNGSHCTLNWVRHERIVIWCLSCKNLYCLLSIEATSSIICGRFELHRRFKFRFMCTSGLFDGRTWCQSQ